MDIQRNTVSDDAHSVFIKNAAWKKMQGKSAVLVYNCVARIGAALKTDNDIRLLREHIGNFAFTLIAPVGTYYCSNHN